jgi:ankyrin repeat protein
MSVPAEDDEYDEYSGSIDDENDDDDSPFRRETDEDEPAQRAELLEEAATILAEAKEEFARRLAEPEEAEHKAAKERKSRKKPSERPVHRMDGGLDGGLLSGCTLMTAAAAGNDVAFMQALIDAGASATALRPVDDASPLLCAVLCGAVEAVAWLLDRGVSIDVLEEIPDTPPIWQAIECGQEEVALLLVERGADLNRVVDPRANLLAFAVSRNMVRLSRRLAEAAPHLIAQQMASNSDLLISSCVLPDFMPLTEHILAHFAVDLGARGSGTSFHALYLAADHGSLPHVELLLAHGAAVDQPTKRGTALHAAANRGDAAIVELLLARGAAVEPAKRWASYTPLMLATRNGHVAVARRLVEAGASTDALSSAGDTLLHLAACSGNADVVRFVLPFCNIEQPDHGGTTAALWACNATTPEFDEVLDVLLEAGAKVDTIDDEAWSPITALAANGRFDAVKRLVERGAISVHFETKGTNLVYYAAECGHVEMLRWLIAQGVAIDMASTAGTAQVGETPLFVAAEADQLEALRVLADAGANMRHATPAGDTPLSIAARNGHVQCVRYLLRRGVRPVRRDIEQCVEHADQPGALIALIASGCEFDAALLLVAKNALSFAVLWHAGVPLGADTPLSPLSTALARVCGALPAQECPRGDKCRDEDETHEQLFFHERRSDHEDQMAGMIVTFVDALTKSGLSLINDRATEILLGLQPLALPALVSNTIIDCACPLATLLPMHVKWRLITLVKHFKEEESS